MRPLGVGELVCALGAVALHGGGLDVSFGDREEVRGMKLNCPHCWYAHGKHAKWCLRRRAAAKAAGRVSEAPKPCCAKCLHPGFRRVEMPDTDGRPFFKCDRCDHSWSSGRDGRPYLGHEMNKMGGEG